MHEFPLHTKALSRHLFPDFFIGLVCQLNGVVLNLNKISAKFQARDALIEAYNELRLAIGDQVFKESALRGENNWLYYFPDLDDYQRLNSLAEKDMARTARALNEFAVRVAERGGKVIVVFVPSKVSVYPEYMPLAIPTRKRPSKSQALSAYLQTKINAGELQNVTVVNTLTLLQDAKAENQVYYQTDTHWNELGAYLGYSATMQAMGIVPRRLDEFKIVRTPGKLQNLIRIIRVKSWVEPVVELEPLFQSRAQVRKMTLSAINRNASERVNILTVSTIDDATLPTAVIVHDSFFDPVIPWMQDHFRRSVSFWHFAPIWDTAWVEQESPDFFIIQLSEQKFDAINSFLRR